MANDAGAVGTARLTVTQGGSPSLAQLSGTWTVAFSEPALNAGGTLEGTASSGGIVLFFSRAPVPCPGEPAQTAERAVAANVTISTGRMAGRYVIAGCPGGLLDVVKR